MIGWSYILDCEGIHVKKVLFFITIVCLLSFSLFLFNQNLQDKIIASVSGSDITNGEVASFLKASQLSASFSNSDTSSITNKQTALNYLIEKEIISDLVKENNLSLSEQEVQAIRSSQDETFQLIEDALENGSDTEKMYAQQTMESVEKSAQAYGVSMEEYREMESGLSRGDYPNYIFFECVNYPLSICSDGRQ